MVAIRPLGPLGLSLDSFFNRTYWETTFNFIHQHAQNTSTPLIVKEITNIKRPFLLSRKTNLSYKEKHV